MMYQYHNYAYSSSVPGTQNVAAYSTRQSAAAAAAASHNPFTSTTLTPDVAGRTDESAGERDLMAMMMTSPSRRHPTPGATSTCLDRSPVDVFPPPPTSTGRLTSPGGRPVRSPASAVYSTPLDRVAVRVDADDNDDDDARRQQHTRSHSAPAAARRNVDHHVPPSCTSPPPLWYVASTDRRLDAERPPPPQSASTSTPRDSTTNARHRQTFPLSNGPVVEAGVTMRRPNSVNLPTASGCSRDAVLTRPRLRASRGRLAAAGDCVLGSALAGMAIVAAVALVFSAVAVQLLLRLTTHDATETSHVDSLLPAGGATITRTVVREVAVALSAVTVTVDLCCLLTVSIQCFFAVKLAHYRNGESVRYI